MKGNAFGHSGRLVWYLRPPSGSVLAMPGAAVPPVSTAGIGLAHRSPANALPLMGDDIVNKTANNMAKSAYSVTLIDTCPLTRECIRQMLAIKAQEMCVQCFAQFPRPDEIPDALLLNASSGLACLEQIPKYLVQVPIIVMSPIDDTYVIRECFRRFGLRGYIPASYSAAIMVAALRLVIAGGTFVPTCLVDFRPEPLPGKIQQEPIIVAGELTTREQQVLQLLREGKPNKIIAFELSISEQTVKVHVKHMMKKLNTTNRTQIAVMAS